MDREIQENYAKIITEIFDNTFPVEPYQITDEVIEMADTMFNDIVQCNEKLIPLPILMEGFAGFIVPPEFEFLFGDKTFKQYVLDRGLFNQQLILKTLMHINWYIICTMHGKNIPIQIDV